jgi:hypothetical protein
MKRDCVAEWASESGEVDILLVAGSKSFYKDFYKEMAQPGKSRMYNALQAETFEETEELIKNRIKIGTKHWESGERAPKVDEVTCVAGAYIHNHGCASHIAPTYPLRARRRGT